MTGYPQPSITWQRDNEVIDNERDSRVTITGSNLSLSNVQYTDAGEYSIMAINSLGTVGRRYNVIIQFIPLNTITRTPDRDEVDDDAMIMVSCTVRSHPQSAISWEQITALSEIIDRTSVAATEHSTGGNTYTTSRSIIGFTADIINGSREFCCIADNGIGTNTKCLNFIVPHGDMEDGDMEDGEMEDLETSDSALEPWAIALTVILPTVTFVVILSIGIICVFQRRALFKGPGRLPAENNATILQRIIHALRRRALFKGSGGLSAENSTSYRIQRINHALQRRVFHKGPGGLRADSNGPSYRIQHEQQQQDNSSNVFPPGSALSNSGKPTDWQYHHLSTDVASTHNENSSTGTAV